MLQKMLFIIMYLLLGYAAAPAGAAWYLAAINPDGSNGPYTAASGILPGSNPDDPASRIAPLRLKNDAIPMPLWQERRLPKTAPGMLQSARMFFKKKRQSIQALELTAYAIGKQKSFWVQDDNDVLWREVTATCAGEKTKRALLPFLPYRDWIAQPSPSRSAWHGS